MGRLVTPLSQEEWDKLPAWQKWISRNAVWVVPLVTATVIVVALIAINVFK